MVQHTCHTLDAHPANPEFVASYLRVAGDECAFIDTSTARSVPGLLSALEARGLDRRSVRYVIVTHAHLDHAGGAGALMSACPEATLLAHPRAARHLIDPTRLVASARQVYGAERFHALFGELTPVDPARARPLDHDAVVPFGGATLRFLHARGHAKHHFVVHDPAIDAVFTGDAFGLHYPSLQRMGTFSVPSTSPTDFEPDEARRSLELVRSLGARTAYPTHFGAVHDIDGASRQLAHLLCQAEEWLHEATGDDRPTETIERLMGERWQKAIEAEALRIGLTLGPSDWKRLALDVELNAQGVAFAADRKRKGQG